MKETEGHILPDSVHSSGSKGTREWNSDSAYDRINCMLSCYSENDLENLQRQYDSYQRNKQQVEERFRLRQEADSL